MPEHELPLSFHCVSARGIILHVDAGVRREIESWINEGKEDRSETLVVETIFGEEVTLVSDDVSLLFSSTPESRALDHALVKMLKDEVPIEDRSE